MGKKNRGNKVSTPKELPLNKYAVNNRMINSIILLILAVIPLIVHLKMLQMISPQIDPLAYFSTREVSDFFSYYQQKFLLVFTGVLTAAFLFHISKKRIQAQVNIINIFLVFFFLLLVVSVLSSPYKSMALWGAENRHMGFITYVCLIFIMMIILLTKFKEKVYNKLFYALYPLTIINTLLIICNFFNINLLDSDLIRMLMMGKYAGSKLNEGYAIVGTFSHGNYLSGFGAILFSLFCGKALFASKTGTEKMVNLSMAALAGFIIFCSKSLSGVVTLIFVMIFLATVVIEKKSFREIYSFLGLIVILFVEFFFLNLYNSFLLKDIVGNLAVIGITCILAVFIGLIFLLSRPGQKHVYKRAFACIVLVFILGGSLSIYFSDTIRYKIDKELVKMDSQTIAQNLAEDEFNLPAKNVALGSGRLYLWKSTLFMVIEKPFFGYGLDTIAYNFNQADPAKISSLEDQVLVDKPHNIYLYILYGAGGFAFLAYLLIVVSIVIQGAKMIAHQRIDYNLQYPLLLGVMAYAYQGLFNDPVIGIEIIGWIIMGYSCLLSGKDRMVVVRQ